MTILRKLQYELIKKSFDIDFLKGQIDLLNNRQRNEYLKHLLNQFKEKGLGHWEVVVHGFEDIGKVYQFDEDFPEDYLNNFEYHDSQRENSFAVRNYLPVFFEKLNFLYQNTISFSDEKTQKTNVSKTNLIQAPAIALFCRIVEHSKTEKRGHDEKRETFCMKVCKKYSLPYTDRVRQNFNDIEPELKETNKNFIKIKEHILPKLPNETRGKIDMYITAKTKLHG